MRVAYLDASAGISGDMFVAALIDAGAPVEILQQTLARLDIGATLEVHQVKRGGLRALKADVLVGSALAETVSTSTHSLAHTHEIENGHSHSHDHSHEDDGGPAHANDHGHRHDFAGENRVISHDAMEHRSLRVIRELIARADLPELVTQFAFKAFEELGRAEAKVHDIPLEDVHFHEVGAVDAIADIVLAAAAVHELKIGAWHVSPVNVGSGTVQCAHGRMPVPAPATAELLLGVPTYSSGTQMELTTPTGAALLKALSCHFGAAPAMRIGRLGYGAGGRDPQGFANVLRISIGDADVAVATGETVTVIETAIDDLNPQVLAYVTEQALKLGALDVVCVAAQMKKNRQGTLLTVLAPPDRAVELQDLLLRETSSLGLRTHDERRVCLAREWISVETSWGPVRIKVARRDGREWNAAPEFEDCRAIAEQNSVALKHVLAAALQAYRSEHPL